MKCINKRRRTGAAGVLLAACLFINGCGAQEPLENKYDIFDSTSAYGLDMEQSGETTGFFAEDLCVTGTDNILSEDVTESLSEAAGLFNTENKEVKFAKNIYQKIYPASTTKILTAYVALKHGDLNAAATVTEEHLQLEAGSSICGLSEGDTLSLEQLLYGLMLCSGNDAANVIAELISGSNEEFVKLMNQEARTLGATKSNFVNAHGLHDENHYTTAYDMYLIFNAAVQNEQFLRLINAKSYTAAFTNSAGEPVNKEWDTTNKYLKGEETVPEGISVTGGKTGTTNDAGYCLVLYSKKDDKIPYISVIYKADSRDNLYHEMSELLAEISK